MRKVYLIYQREKMDREVVGAFTSKTKAEKLLREFDMTMEEAKYRGFCVELDINRFYEENLWTDGLL